MKSQGVISFCSSVGQQSSLLVQCSETGCSLLMPIHAPQCLPVKSVSASSTDLGCAPLCRLGWAGRWQNWLAEPPPVRPGRAVRIWSLLASARGAWWLSTGAPGPPLSLLTPPSSHPLSLLKALSRGQYSFESHSAVNGKVVMPLALWQQFLQKLALFCSSICPLQCPPPPWSPCLLPSPLSPC